MSLFSRGNISPVVPWTKDTPPPKLEIHTYDEITICDICKKLLRYLTFETLACALNQYKLCILEACSSRDITAHV